MPKLHAQAYSYDGPGFYFDDLEEYEKKYERHLPTEEYEIQFIDGDELDLGVFNAMRVAQWNLEEYFDVVDSWDDETKLKLALLVDHGFDLDGMSEGDIEEAVTLYGEHNSDADFAFELIDSMGGVGEALGPDQIESNFDYESFGRDLRIGGDLYDEDDPEGERWDGMSDEEIGEEWVDSMGGVKYLDTETLVNYFDYERFARDLMFDYDKEGRLYYRIEH